jgi:hypothetical protein
MSYEPILVIKKTDLDKHSKSFEKFWEWENNKDEKRVMEYLKEVYEKYDRVKIDDIELILCTPEFSSFNSLVREKLEEWGVQFGVSN